LRHNRCMAEGRFSAKQWQLQHAEDWTAWVEGSQTSRIARMTRLAEGVRRLTTHWITTPAQSAQIIPELPRTLKCCNELAFSTESETLAYTIWHLVDRYGRILQVLDELLARGHLPLRKTRLSALEIGAGPSPALYAIKDFYYDLNEWAGQVDARLGLTPATHLLSLDRGAAWSHLVHNLSEELLLLGDDAEPHLFGINYREFESFSVQTEHREAIARIARSLIADAEHWDEYLEPSHAQNQAIASQDYPPGAIDLIILCNFLTETEMTRTFADELEGLADSLTPGGILLVIGSQDKAYDAIFNELSSLITQSGRVQSIFRLDRVASHPDPKVHEIVSSQIVDCLLRCASKAPGIFSLVSESLPADVRRPGEVPIKFPDFRVAAFKCEGKRPRGRWGRRWVARAG
jgi:hypothetical protein